MKPKILTLLLCSSLAASETVSAQNISFNPFSSAPLMLNPAFTGMFDGKLRANALYRREWRSVNVPNVGMAASVDQPVYTRQNSYWAVGGQVFKGQAGDGDLTNFYGLASAAFHQKLKHSIKITGGVQLGYTRKYLDFSPLYFNQPPQPPSWTSFYYPPVAISTYAVNVGVSFYQGVSRRFNYIVGLSFNNINQPNDRIERRQNQTVGNDMHCNGVVSANFQAAKRFGVRPSFLYQFNLDRQYMIGGSEFHYGYDSRKEDATLTKTVFAGMWYRNEGVSSIMAGTETSRFRFSLSYDYYVATPYHLIDGDGGLEVAARYIIPNRK